MEISKRSNAFFDTSISKSREELIQRLTKRLLQFALEKTGTKMIIILGHLRSGKSSLFEAITNSKGHSQDGIDPVTKEYQIGRARINNEIHLFVDTPGLDDPNISNAAILTEIHRLLDVTRDSVIYAGIIYVFPVSVQFSDEMQRGLKFLESFCGLDYSPFITFVTTMWDELQESGVRRHDLLINELAQKKWNLFIARGANLYHHGRRYEHGDATLETLHITNQRIARRTTAREVIGNIYPPGAPYAQPLIVQELMGDIPLANTTFGMLLGMTSLALIHSPRDEATGPQEERVDWIGALIEVQKVQSWAISLWRFLESLQSRISSAMNLNISVVAMSLHRFGANQIEALISLPGGLKFIVGYGLSGLYWRPWRSGDAQEAGYHFSDGESGSETEDEPEDYFEDDNDSTRDSRYAAIGEIFDHVVSTMGNDQDLDLEPAIPESSSYVETRQICSLM